MQLCMQTLAQLSTRPSIHSKPPHSIGDKFYYLEHSNGTNDYTCTKVARIIRNSDDTYRSRKRSKDTNDVKILCFQKNGELLMLDNNNNMDHVLMSYNPQTMALRKLSFDTGLAHWSLMRGVLFHFPARRR